MKRTGLGVVVALVVVAAAGCDEGLRIDRRGDDEKVPRDLVEELVAAYVDATMRCGGVMTDLQLIAATDSSGLSVEQYFVDGIGAIVRAELTAPGVALNEDVARVCIEHFADAACSPQVSLLRGGPCRDLTRGTLADGAPCVGAQQCVSARCAYDDEGCGACAPPLVACGDDLNCSAGEHCAQGSCAPQGNAGDSCAFDQDCSSGFCVDSVCAAAAAVDEMIGYAPGESCDVVLDRCGNRTTLSGLFCDPETATCAQRSIAREGDDCDQETICVGSLVAGALCVDGTCTKPGAPGEACTAAGCFESFCDEGAGECVAYADAVGDDCAATQFWCAGDLVCAQGDEEIFTCQAPSEAQCG